MDTKDPSTEASLAQTSLAQVPFCVDANWRIPVKQAKQILQIAGRFGLQQDPLLATCGIDKQWL